jgi:hypothetical protein
MRLALALALLMAAAGAAVAGDEGRTPKPVIERAATGAQCVGDPAFMRRNHMDLLKHQRDDTVRQGVRSAAYSLKACVECHASRKTGSVVRAPTDFCVSCHSYAAVKTDCFECHAAEPKPKGTAFHPLVPSGPGGAGAIRLAATVRQIGREGSTP